MDFRRLKEFVFCGLIININEWNNKKDNVDIFLLNVNKNDVRDNMGKLNCQVRWRYLFHIWYSSLGPTIGHKGNCEFGQKTTTSKCWLKGNLVCVWGFSL